ncbi:MAG: DUF4397 domain-containing protein [Gemmatimonadaceae bacterium]|nr:DUF4397 domain-containing protein [Gemmatimonadaceae bacterium]
MRFRHLSILLFGAAALAGCNSDEVSGTRTELEPAALVRYVNAVPDTSALDFRFTDGNVENSPQFPSIAYRQFTVYQRARAGSRRIAVFTNPLPYGSDIAVAQQKHVDTSFNFEAGKRYTIISYGFARATASPRHRLVIIEDVFPTTLAATSVGARTIHAAPAAGPLDVYVQTSESPAGIAGATPVARNVAALAATPYVTLTSRPVGGALVYRWDLAAAGGTTALAVSPSSGLPGQAGTSSSNPLAGFQIGRSVITAIAFGPSVAGSRAPQGGEYASLGMRFLPDQSLDSTEPGR